MANGTKSCPHCGMVWHTEYAANLCCAPIPDIQEAFDAINVEIAQNILTEEERKEMENVG